MKEIKAEQITQVVRDLCIEANCHLPKDVQEAITTCKACEPFPIAQTILGILIMMVRRPGHIASLTLNGLGVLLFSLSLQPYAAAFSFVFLMIKVFLLIKKR